jgi:hypothetical protein
VTLRYPFRLQRTSQPVLSLGGRFVRPQPILAVNIIGPTNSWIRDGLLDTGSDDVVFPDHVAGLIGIDLKNPPTGAARGVGTGVVALRYAEATLRVVGQNEHREWQAWVGFTSAPLRRPLLGFAGFLQFFDSLYRGALEEFDLKVNPLYPGT